MPPCLEPPSHRIARPHPLPGAVRTPGATAVCGLLVLAVALVYGQTLGMRSSNYDDLHLRLRRAARLGWLVVVGDRAGHSPMARWANGIRWRCSRTCSIASCMACSPGGHHLTNVLLHAASAVVLFLVLWRMTGALWPSALVAALVRPASLAGRVGGLGGRAARRAQRVVFHAHARGLWRAMSAILIAGALSGRGRAVRLGPDGQADAGDAAAAVAAARLLALGTVWPVPRRCRAEPGAALREPPPRAVSMAAWSWKSCRWWRWPLPRPA